MSLERSNRTLKSSRLAQFAIASLTLAMTKLNIYGLAGAPGGFGGALRSGNEPQLVPIILMVAANSIILNIFFMVFDVFIV